MRGWTEQFSPKTQVQFWLICHGLENIVHKNGVSEHHTAGFWACKCFTNKTKQILFGKSESQAEVRLSSSYYILGIIALDKTFIPDN